MRVRRRLAILSLASLLSLLSLLSFLFGCQPEDSPQGLTASAKTQKARIFLIAIEDGGNSGPEVGCDDSAVAVEEDLPVPQPALRASLEALLAAGKRHESAGYYNALANSPLRLERIERSGGAARIYLTGYLELGGECDSPRVLAQLEQTATQFRDVQKAEFFLGGKPLADLLSGKG
jgi:Sporulation and spore germination